MERRDQSSFKPIGKLGASNFSLVRYPGNFLGGSVSAYLEETEDRYDAIVTFNIRFYDTARNEAQEKFDGPIILLESVQRRVAGDFIRARSPILPTDFNKLVREYVPGP